MAIDYTTSVGQVRLLIADVDEAEPILSDDQINGFLGLNPTSIRLAAADALDAIATSEALTSKVIKTQDLQTDGAKLADSLRAQAKQLREQAQAVEDDFVFDVVYPCDNAYRVRLGDEWTTWGL